MQQTYYLGLLGAALLAGCHRDAEGPAYDLSGRYTAATTITPANPVQLFATQGVVTDAVVVGQYLARHQALATGYFSTAEAPTAYPYTLQLVFRSSNRATFVATYPSRVDTTRTEVTDQQLTSFQLQALDSVTVRSNPVAGTDVIGQLTNAICLVQAGRKCKPLYTNAPGYPGGSSTTEECRVRPVYLAGAHGSQLYLPYLSWMLWSKGTIVGYRNLNNFFNSAARSYLTAGDTLLVQERELALRR